jgi:hypothetical protein
MAVATRLQVGRRVVAALAGLTLVATMLLGIRHRAEVTHVVDPATGRVLHAQHLIGHHDQSGHGADVHDRADGDRDIGECSLAAALESPAAATLSFETSVVAPSCMDDASGPAFAVAVREVYRFAPKTSPPLA